MREGFSNTIALSGILAALAIVIMCLGGLIPVATYVCPVLCALICFVVLHFCGKRIVWTWYAAVSILSTLIGPDKEAAFIFVFLGYYPIIKHSFDRCPFCILLKALYFNASVILAYSLMIFILGFDIVLSDLTGLGFVWLCVLLVLGNITFFLLDALLKSMSSKIYGFDAGSKNG